MAADREAKLEAALKEAKEKLQEMQSVLEKVTTPPLLLGTVAQVRKKEKQLVMMIGGQLCMVPWEGTTWPKAGTPALISPMTKGIVDFIKLDMPGPTMVFKRYLTKELAEVDQSVGGMSGGAKVVYWTEPDIKPGNLVLTDQGSMVILKDLGPPPTVKQFTPEESSRVHFSDIGGLDDVRDLFEEIIKAPLLNPEIYAFYGIKPPKGLLLSGKPGCGKTLLARAMATEICESYGSGGDSGFINVKGPEILSPFVGMAEQRIRDLFAEAQRFREERGFPAIIFIDEAESVMNRRGSGHSSDVDRTIVPAFLAEMDGVETSGAMVILATNRPELLDPAITRDGRIDKKITIPRPGREASKAIFDIYLRKVPLVVAEAELVELATEYLFAPQHVLYSIYHKSRSSPEPFCLHQVTSGAMIANVVQLASRSAMRRDLQRKERGGVGVEDVTLALDDVVKQNRGINHDDDIADHVAAWRDDVDRIVKHA